MAPVQAQVRGPEPASFALRHVGETGASSSRLATPAAHLCLISPYSTHKNVNLTSARKNATRSRRNVCCYSGVLL